MKLPSSLLGYWLACSVFTDLGKKFPAFFCIYQHFAYSTVYIEFNAGTVNIPEISQGKICRTFVTGKVTVEAGRTDSIKAVKQRVKGKVVKDRMINSSFGDRNIHDLFFPGNAFTSHINSSDLSIRIHVPGLQDLKVIFPYARAWNAMADIITGVKICCICMSGLKKTAYACNLAWSAGEEYSTPVFKVITDRIIDG